MKHLIRAFILSLPLIAIGAEINPPVHPDEAAVIRGIVSVENYQAATVVDVPKWGLDGAKRELNAFGLETDSLKSWRIEVKNDPRPYRGGFFSCLYNADGRIVALSGNGPWLRNESLRALTAMPELRSIHWDHNGFVSNHPETDLYDGTGFDALANSKLIDIKIGLSFNDKGMEQCAKIKSLRRFGVAHSRVTDAGVAFFEGHSGLTSFSVSEMGKPLLTGKALASIAKIPNVNKIGFGESYITYTEGFAHLAPLKDRLVEFDITMSIASPADLDKFKADHPNMKITGMLTPEQIVKRHSGAAANIAKKAPPELAAPLNAAIEQMRKK